MSTLECMKFCLEKGNCTECKYHSDLPMLTCKELMRDAISKQSLQDTKYKTLLLGKGVCAGAIVGIAICALIMKLI